MRTHYGGGGVEGRRGGFEEGRGEDNGGRDGGVHRVEKLEQVAKLIDNSTTAGATR